MQSEYEITGYEACGRNKHKVLLDGEYAFCLYDSELRKLHITGESRISADTFTQIREILYKRGLSRSLHLIKDRDYTSGCMLEKLLKADYPDDIADMVVLRLCEENLINDRRYAQNYVISYMDSKSRRQITYALMKKGIGADMIREAFDKAASVYDMDGIESKRVEKLIKRKLETSFSDAHHDISYEERMKIFAYVARKGYDFSVINKVWCDLGLEYIGKEE